MFNFTTNTVINSPFALDVEGKPKLDHNGADLARYFEKDGKFHVIGTGVYDKKNIRSIYKRGYQAGVREEAKLEFDKQDAGTILRLTTVIKLQENTKSTYVNFSYDFKQPLTVEITSTGVLADDIEALAKVINKMKVEYGRSLFVAEATATQLNLKVRTFDQRFESIKLEKVDPDDNKIAPEITLIKEGEVTTPGGIGFGDDAWMIRAVEFPSYENSRHFRAIKDERPILGGNYSQYTLNYHVDMGEQQGVWQASNVTMTNHVFWVREDLVNEFEIELKKVFPDVEPVGDVPSGNHESNPGGEPGVTEED